MSQLIVGPGVSSVGRAQGPVRNRPLADCPQSQRTSVCVVTRPPGDPDTHLSLSSLALGGVEGSLA